MSTKAIYQTILRVVKRRMKKERPKLLDIGAGRGDLLRVITSELDVSPYACDYHVELFRMESVPLEKVNLNTDVLPYADDTFDIVTCSEVIEHLENFRALLREARRVLKKDGLLVVTTPNVLNMKSRIRYLVSGFFNLFGPLPVRNEKLYSTGGHITPIPYFYLTHALMDAGFKEIELDIDRRQKTSVAYLIISLPLILLGWILFISSERRRYKTLNSDNEPVVKRHLSIPMLTGRTIAVSSVKK